jgi:TolB protein
MTTGADPGDGYIVEINATGEQHFESRYVGLNNSALFTNLTPGQYRIQLGGIKSNCAVAGDNPRTVSVTVGQTTASTFNVACVAVTTSLEVWTSSCGSHIDQDGYTISIDGVVRETIGVNAADTLSVEGLGEHTVFLGDVASECVVCGSNPRVMNVTRMNLESARFAWLFPVLCSPNLTGKIAFVRYKLTCGGWGWCVTTDIRLLSPDHRCPIRLSNTRMWDSDPALSQDGEKIAFVESLQDAPLRIIIMNTDGTAVTRLEQPYASHPSWSPDGGRIAFAKSSSPGDVRDSDIYLIDVDGTGLVNLTGHLGAVDIAPAWSPDGDRIVFVSAGDLFVIGVDGMNLTRLTQDTESNDDPAWSPDAARIAFTCEREGSNEICVMNADGTGLLQLTNDPAGSRDPVWSPDGAKIAFTRSYTSGFPYDPNHTTVFLMNADGSEAEPLIDRASAPTWSRAQ